MKAAMFYRKEDLRVIEAESPQPQSDEALIEVKACGVCGTDVHILHGVYPVKAPLILGHEASGRVVEVGDLVKNISPGDDVAIDPNITCGRCYFCRIGQAHLCENLKAVGVTRDGAFAQRVTVPETNVYRLPKGISYEEGALAEPISCCIHGADLASIRQGDTVTVLGAGPIGLIHTQLARLYGASTVITVTGRHEERLKRAKKIGADYTINSSDEDPVSKIRSLTEGRGSDVVIEATGNPVAVEQAIAMARRGGHVVVFGCAPKDAKIEVSPLRINDDEILIFGSFNNPYTFDRAVKLIQSGAIKTEPLISHEFDLKDIANAFRTATSGELFFKILVKP